MRAVLAATLLVALSLSTSKPIAGAEPFRLTVPNQGWFLTFESPPLINYLGQTKGKNFQFRAVGETGFNVSMFVEEPKAKADGHEACFNYYWPLAKRNPMVDQKTVKVTKTDRYVKVSYSIKVRDGDKEVASPHVNYYFAFQDRWMDVHTSRYPPGKDDDDVLGMFEKSISYRALKDADRSP